MKKTSLPRLIYSNKQQLSLKIIKMFRPSAGSAPACKDSSRSPSLSIAFLSSVIIGVYTLLR